MDTLAPDTLARRFERFARYECHGSSPLYERLALGIAADPELLALAARCRPGQPAPNLLLAAVHDLLLDSAAHPLAAYYPSVSGSPPPDDDPYPAFQAFCLANRAAIEHLVTTRLVQTNEVRRCACLVPAFALVAARAGDRPLALVEIGASAGLNLLWDRYGYDYGDGRRTGDTTSPVQIPCSPRGAVAPPLPESLPVVAFRAGIDLHPIDVRDPAEVRCLRALVWPEHADRADRLLRAVALAQGEPPRLLAGDALDLLPDLLSQVPAETALCVYHTHTVNQFAPAARERLSAILAEHGRRRDLYRVSIEAEADGRVVLRLAAFEAARHSEADLASCDPHGGWIEWLQRGSPP